MRQVKYGGVQFTANVPPQEINEFVANLSEENRTSLYRVIKELANNDLITLHGFEHPHDEEC